MFVCFLLFVSCLLFKSFSVVNSLSLLLFLLVPVIVVVVVGC